MNYSIVPVHLAVRAMRDNGYKNAAYAIAELMDNSIQAGAKRVELLCAETVEPNAQRERRRVKKIAVLDNASGMNAETLRLALQFGNGTRLEPGQHTGIGRFGMGLPASSMSQCKRVEVWTWQDGPENALHTFLDLDEIISQQMSEVPEPKISAPPELWRSVGKAWGTSGTLVVWSTLDRLMWKTALALIDNSEIIIGRMYRKFLAGGEVKIRLVAFQEDRPQNLTIERYARPNDPAYLMTGTATPAPYDTIPLFEPWGGGGDHEITHDIEFRGQSHPVTIRYSFAKEIARQGVNPGARDYGKHAARNTGLSIVRARRELELDVAWADPRDRWWGIEVEFPPALDEIFGVTNNKQHAHYFSGLANFNIDDRLKDGMTVAELQENLAADEDPAAPLIGIAMQIQKTRNVLRRLLRAQTATDSDKRRKGGRHGDDKNSPEGRATEVTRDRQEQGHKGKSDFDEGRPAEERQEEIEAELEGQGVPTAAAKELAARTVSTGLKYVFAHADLETPAFFSVRQKGGSIIITLNTSHPAFSSLVEVLERDPEQDDTDEDLKRRLDNALDGLKLLFMAWARYEDEQPDGRRRDQAQETRLDWGRLARQFLQREE